MVEEWECCSSWLTFPVWVLLIFSPRTSRYLRIEGFCVSVFAVMFIGLTVRPVPPETGSGRCRYEVSLGLSIRFCLRPNPRHLLLTYALLYNLYLQPVTRSPGCELKQVRSPGFPQRSVGPDSSARPVKPLPEPKDDVNIHVPWNIRIRCLSGARVRMGYCLPFGNHSQPTERRFRFMLVYARSGSRIVPVRG